MIKIGAKYKHFKGMEMRVLGIAKDCETLEDVVIYIHLGDGEIWTRPAKTWFDQITRPGVNQPRFVEIQE